MKTYIEEEVVNILQHIENKGFNEDCLTMNEELKHLEEIGVVKNCSIQSVSQQRELLLAYHKHLDSFNDPTIYNASEEMIDDYLANNCG